MLRILRSGSLLSRQDAADADIIAHDIAPPEIIGLNPDAHRHVRLYFRPKTPTQYHIEGIREPADFYQGKHAPVLFMLVFSSEGILTTDGVQFSDGNMQLAPAVYGDNDGFECLDFNDIFHEGTMPTDDVQRIIRARCSEVLCPSPLDLEANLQAIICRSSAERQFLLHELGPNFPKADKVRVFNEAGVFNADFAFVESVDLATDGVHIAFHSPRRGSSTGKVEVQVIPTDGHNQPIYWSQDQLEFWKKWRFSSEIGAGRYLVEVKVRDCLAYRSYALLEDAPF